jgi:RNA polymerase sigma-70 factor (ECF subfamily)
VEILDKNFADRLRNGDQQAFEMVFVHYYRGLHAYANSMIADDERAAELVQDLFCRVWNKKRELNYGISLKAYLYKAIYYACLDDIKHDKIKAHYRAEVLYRQPAGSTPEEAAQRTLLNDLEKKLTHALNQLPVQCRTIFQLSRFEGLKYQEIATQLDISIKTVETQMSIALKRLRHELAEFIS